MNTIEQRKWNDIYKQITNVSKYWKHSNQLNAIELQNVIHTTIAKLYEKEEDGIIQCDNYEDYKAYAFIVANNNVLKQLQNRGFNKNKMVDKAEELSFNHFGVCDDLNEWNNLEAILKPYQMHIISLKIAGYTQSQIAFCYGVTSSCIQRYFQDIKIKLSLVYGYKLINNKTKKQKAIAE